VKRSTGIYISASHILIPVESEHDCYFPDRGQHPRGPVHIPVATLWAHYTGGNVEAGLAQLEVNAEAMIDDLLWWTEALKTARNRAA
jgi:hypothetical protein